LIILDFFIVNVALPSVQRDLSVGNTALEWLVAGYGLTFGGLLLLASRVADRWGRRRMFCLGIALFVATSAACGFAPDVGTLLVARLAQGAAAAAIGPTVLALIGDVYAGPARIRALGMYATVMGVAAASGQLIGGLLIHLDLFGLGWRTVFLANVPVGLAALAAAPRLLPDSRIADAPRVDVVEATLTVGTLTALVLPLVEGQRQGWPAWTWICLVGSVVLGTLGYLRGTMLRRRGVRPLIDIAPLRNRPVGFGLAGQALLFTGMASYFLVLAIYLQDGRGLGPLASGVVFSIVALAYMFGTREAAPLVMKYGVRATVLAAALVFGVGHLALLAAVEWHGIGGSVLWLAPGLAIGGLGMGVALSALVGTVMASVDPRDAGAVSGTSSTVQQVGNALGVALVGIVFFGRLDHGIANAFEASLVYLAATTIAVAVAAVFLPGRPRLAMVDQSAKLSSRSSAAA
jgi:MFS family permease